MFGSGIVDKLMYLLESTLYHYSNTIDEYGLAHYFADLRMDDFIKLYVQAAADRKLKVDDEEIGGDSVELIEPTCILDIESLEKTFLEMKRIIEEQIDKKQFWLIDEKDKIFNMTEKSSNPATHWCCLQFYY